MHRGPAAAQHREVDPREQLQRDLHVGRGGAPVRGARRPIKGGLHVAREGPLDLGTGLPRHGDRDLDHPAVLGAEPLKVRLQGAEALLDGALVDPIDTAGRDQQRPRLHEPLPLNVGAPRRASAAKLRRGH